MMGEHREFFINYKVEKLPPDHPRVVKINPLFGIRLKLKQKSAISRLITGGAYGILRHPLYTAGILLIFTKTEMTLLDFTAAALVSIYFIAGAFIEERRLVSAFGDEYMKYQQRVSVFNPVKWFIKRISGATR